MRVYDVQVVSARFLKFLKLSLAAILLIFHALSEHSVMVWTIGIIPI